MLPTSPARLTVRRVTDPTDPALEAFASVQNASYYAPDMLIPPQMFPELVSGRAGREDRLLVAENERGEVLGGTIYHLLPGAGFNSFMGVAPAAQGLGVGRALHRASLEDAAAAGRAGMFADSVYGGRQSRDERAAEARTGTNAGTRRRVLGALGLRVVDLPYWQPVGGPDGGPVTDLDLLYAPLTAGGVQGRTPQTTVPLGLVLGVMEAYWRGWLGPERAATEVERLREAAEGENVPLLPAETTPRFWTTPEAAEQR